MINLYYTFIYPYLIYGVEFWGHAPDYLISKLLMCQKNSLRITVLSPIDFQNCKSYRFQYFQIQSHNWHSESLGKPQAFTVPIRGNKKALELSAWSLISKTFYV